MVPLSVLLAHQSEPLWLPLPRSALAHIEDGGVSLVTTLSVSSPTFQDLAVLTQMCVWCLWGVAVADGADLGVASSPERVPLAPLLTEVRACAQHRARTAEYCS